MLKDRIAFSRRFIVHSDDHNPYLASIEAFEHKLKDFHPDLLVVGGMQMMDNFPFQKGDDNINTSSDMMEKE